MHESRLARTYRRDQNQDAPTRARKMPLAILTLLILPAVTQKAPMKFDLRARVRET